jgi:hypothetical protein
MKLTLLFLLAAIAHHAGVSTYLTCTHVSRLASVTPVVGKCEIYFPYKYSDVDGQFLLALIASSP